MNITVDYLKKDYSLVEECFQEIVLGVQNVSDTCLRNLQLKISSPVFRGIFKAHYAKIPSLEALQGWPVEVCFMLDPRHILPSERSAEIELIYQDADDIHHLLKSSFNLNFIKDVRPQQLVFKQVVDNTVGISNSDVRAWDNSQRNRMPLIDNSGLADLLKQFNDNNNTSLEYVSLDLRESTWMPGMEPATFNISLNVDKHFSRGLEDDFEFHLSGNDTDNVHIEIKPVFHPTDIMKSDSLTRIGNRHIAAINCGSRQNVRLTGLTVTVRHPDNSTSLYEMPEDKILRFPTVERDFHKEPFYETIPLFKKKIESDIKSCSRCILVNNRDKLFVFTGGDLKINRQKEGPSDKLILRAMPHDPGSCSIDEFKKTGNTEFLCENCLLTLSLSRQIAELSCLDSSVQLNSAGPPGKKHLCDGSNFIDKLHIDEKKRVFLRPAICKKTNDNCRDNCKGFALDFRIFKGLEFPEIDSALELSCPCQDEKIKTDVDSVYIERSFNYPLHRYLLLPRVAYISSSLKLVDRQVDASLILIYLKGALLCFPLEEICIDGKEIPPGKYHFIIPGQSLKIGTETEIKIKSVTNDAMCEP